MKQIPLTKKKMAFVSDEDYAEVSCYKWCATDCAPRGKPKWYAKRKIYVDGKPRTLYMHEFVMNRMGVVPPLGYVRDHFPDRNGLNNQRGNLRIITFAQNVAHCQFKKREEPWL